MTKLSRKPLNDEKLGHLVNELWSAFVLMDSKDDIRLLFRDLFTHTEYKMLAKRLAIARLLLEGQNYDLIRDNLNVTPGTISHVSNVLSLRGEGYRKAHVKLNEIDNDYQRKIVQRQAQLERRVRRKLPEETFIGDTVMAGLGALDRAITRKVKRNSAKKHLTL